jgi:ligand-binding sensor domain-containing protein
VLATSFSPRPAHATWQNFQASTGGLSDNVISSIAEGPDGGIWLGTSAHSASAFDGVRWRTLTDSLPQGRIRAVLEDRTHRQWFGSDLGGLAMFDGRRWSRFGQATGELPVDDVTAMLEDRRGDLWFGTLGGLARFQPTSGTWTTYVAGAGQLVDNSVTRLFEDSHENLWVATAHGASAFDRARTTWSAYSKSNSGLAQDTVTSICEDVRGRMWFGTNAGVYLFDSNGWSQLTKIPGLPKDLVLAIARDSSGRMWLSGSDGVAHTEGQTFRADRLTPDGVVIGPIGSLLVDSSGNLWLGGTASTFLGWTSHGLFRFDGTGWRNYFSPSSSTLCPAGSSTNVPALQVMSSNCVATALEDDSGNRWFASEGGLTELRPNDTWTVYRRASVNALSDTLIAIARSPDGTMWFGSANAGVTSLDSGGTNWQAFTTTEGLVANDVRTLFVDSRGDLWVGTGSGASRRSGTSWTNFLAGGFPTEVQRISEDRGGHVWLQTSAGLFSVDTPGTPARAWTSADGLPDDIVTAMLSTSDGGMWFGTARGVARLLQGTWTTWKNVGAPGDSSVVVLSADRSGGVWAGSDFVVSHCDGTAWTPYRYPQVLTVPASQIFTDSSGTVWVHSQQSGTSRFNGRAWKKVSGPGSGMTSDATTSTLEDSQLSLWFTSYNGLAEYQPDRVAPQTVFVNQPPALSASRIAGFVYAAAYGEVADLEYSYSWDGASYTSWSTENTLNLSGIADGTHTLRVRARDWVGNVDPTPATYTFEVDATPPQAVIASPKFGDPVRGRVPVVGTASDPRFHDLLVQARPVGTTSWTAPSVITLATSATPVTGDTLARWDTTPLADGNWELRLAATDTLGLVGVASIQVIIDNVAPFAYQTSPVRLVAHDGGDVYTTNGEVHVYFPPAAFDADPLVSVDSTSAFPAPDTLNGTSIRVSAAWSISWTGASLVKSGTVGIRPNASGNGLAIWRDDGSGKWTRLGGTAQPGGALGITLATPGRFALYTQSVPVSTTGGITSLVLTPRAFSPNGHYASRDVAIGFTLARPGGATVKVYNRAGRLVRTVVRGMSGETGANLVRWNGRDDDGHVTEPGLYLVTVEALGETKTEALAVVR